MKTKNLILIILGLTSFIFAGVPARGQNNSGIGTIKGDTVIYTCPLHPEIQSNPGTCPKCGMDLVKKSETAGKHRKKHNMKMMSPMEDMVKNNSPEKDKNTNDPALKDEVLYTCSMHPEIQSKQPGNCPKCGMKLIEKSTVSGKELKRHKMLSMGIGMGLMMTGMLAYMISR